ncbi:vascular endothelial growth factor C-like isoform X2 [Antennarius striatus]|uniref:vascular endothelial growth factor C-like isoform X2 n=1 Tax=Antennarius striatus TaxID=241820 RepID=UPI0035B22BA6
MQKQQNKELKRICSFFYPHGVCLFVFVCVCVCVCVCVYVRACVFVCVWAGMGRIHFPKITNSSQHVTTHWQWRYSLFIQLKAATLTLSILNRDAPIMLIPTFRNIKGRAASFLCISRESLMSHQPDTKHPICCTFPLRDAESPYVVKIESLPALQAPDLPDDKPSLETVTSIDELLQLLYPEYSLLQLCMRRKSWHLTYSSSSSPSFPGYLARSSSLSDEDDLWGQPRKEALFKMDGALGVILEEIQRTSCLPREVCVEVAKEYPESTSHFYLPRCVALHRCGGCCANEAHYCTNTSHTLVNKTLMELSPPRMDRSVVMVTFVNHTSCTCLPKRPLHSIIRRAASDHLCSPPDMPCASGSIWDAVNCMCISTETINYSDSALDSGLLALCGPNRVLDEFTCECVCRNGLTEDSCDPGWKLDHNTCQCQCGGQGEGRPCPAGQRWDEELCGCVCAAECPRNQPLNPDTCLCQCRESPQSCLRQGKRFNSNTCSCYSLPCRKPRPVCQTGFYYSYKVCQCIPNYMRPGWN